MVKYAKFTRRKQFTLDAHLLNAVENLARDSGSSLDKLTEDALRDLLKKYRRPISLEDALQHSVRAVPANDREPRRSSVKG
jgi:hypothetical protein